VPTVCYTQETHLTNKDTSRLKVKGEKTVFQANGIWNQAGVSRQIFNKADMKPKLVIRDNNNNNNNMNNPSRRYKL
jgi:hypothetical protein